MNEFNMERKVKNEKDEENKITDKKKLYELFVSLL